MKKYYIFNVSNKKSVIYHRYFLIGEIYFVTLKWLLRRLIYMKTVKRVLIQITQGGLCFCFRDGGKTKKILRIWKLYFMWNRWLCVVIFFKKTPSLQKWCRWHKINRCTKKLHFTWCFHWFHNFGKYNSKVIVIISCTSTRMEHK